MAGIMNCDCGNKLGPKNKTGHCQACWRRVGLNIMKGDPEFIEKMKQGIQRSYLLHPEKKAAKRDQVRRIAKLPQADAARRESARSRRMWENPAFKDRPAGHPSRIKAGESRSQTVLGWCPEHLRDDYRHMVRKCKYTSEEARAAILEMHRQELVAQWGDRELIDHAWDEVMDAGRANAGTRDLVRA